MENVKKQKWIKTSLILSILALILSTVMWALIIVKVVPFTITTVTISGILTTLAVSVIMCLPWVKHFVVGEYKVASIVFIVLSFITFALLSADIVCVNLIINKIADSKTFEFSQIAGILSFLRVSLVVVLQTIIAIIIANNILKYKKSVVVLQALAYFALLYLDFAISILALSITVENSGLKLVDFSGLIKSMPFWVGLALAIGLWGFMCRNLNRFSKTFNINGINETLTPVAKTNQIEQTEQVDNTENNGEQKG